MNITKYKAVNEIIDGYDAASVPDDIVAERLDSGTFSLANQIDTDGGTTLIAEATVTNVSALTNSQRCYPCCIFSCCTYSVTN